jgi:sugar-specific transcriptional regulator TrmB
MKEAVDMIDELRKIGLSDLEARCYLALHEEPNITGYEVAKHVSVSRTNVYAALRSLTDKGLCRVIEAAPVRYDAVPIDQLVKLLQSDFEQTAQTLLDQLKTPPRASTSFYTWQGDKAIVTTIRRLAANAGKSIIVDIWSEDMHYFEESLLEAEQRGVDIRLIIIGECKTKLSNVQFHKRSDDWDHAASRKFSALCDFQAALIGSFGQTLKLTALETNHPSIVELLRNGFYHDVIMAQIEHDFGKQLSEHYGKNYESIIRLYPGMLE